MDDQFGTHTVPPGCAPRLRPRGRHCDRGRAGPAGPVLGWDRAHRGSRARAPS